LSYGDTVVAANPTWNVAGTIATFSDLDLDLLTEEKVLKVKASSTVINAN